MPSSFSSILKVAALILSLGLDTFAVSIGLGLSGISRREQLRFGVSFALAEGIMPLAGFGVGRVAAGVLANVAGYLAGALLLGVGLYILWEAREGEETNFAAASLLTVVVTALSVSLDELAIGFSLGLLHVTVAPAVSLIAAQAFAVTLLGAALGRRIGHVYAGRAELLSGTILTLLACFLLMKKLIGA